MIVLTADRHQAAFIAVKERAGTLEVPEAFPAWTNTRLAACNWPGAAWPGRHRIDFDEQMENPK